MSPISALPDTPDPLVAAKGYAHPERLVSTDWLAAHLDHPSLRLLECNEDVLLYSVEHIPGAQKLDWHIDLNDQVERDYISRTAFEALLRAKGIDDSTTVVFYGDKNNWWATYAFWVFQLFGFDNAVVLDGGRAKWLAEDRPTTTDVPSFPPTGYTARERNDVAIRAFIDDTRAHMQAGKPMIDVRSPQEYTGEKLHMPDYPQEGTLRADTSRAPAAFRGHARRRPTRRSNRPTNCGRFTKASLASRGDDVVTYCRIGERSSHTWFVLTYLLGFEKVRNYDGSWTEWGNAVRAPIRQGGEP